jgi:CheY-like chemotaxis protein
MSGTNSVTILMADDDADDREMTREALAASHLANEFRFVENGVELMDYLLRHGKYHNPAISPRPGLILLDLNMPKKDGREALSEIKSDPNLQEIPVVVMTTSKEEMDIHRSYQLHANSYIVKPVTFDRLVAVVTELGKYWFDIVKLPSATHGKTSLVQ